MDFSIAHNLQEWKSHELITSDRRNLNFAKNCEVVQLISVSSSFSLGDNCLGVCIQWCEDLIAEQDNDSITLKYSRMLH